MIYLETLLITILIYTCIYVTLTDFKYGLIKNKSLIYAAIPGLIINIIYYSIFANEFFLMYIFNFFIIFVISFILYIYHIWAAGDSKLLILIIFLLPARIYSFNRQERIPGIIIVVSIFLLAFVYVILESIYIAFRNKELDVKLSFKFDVTKFIKQYFISTIYITAFNQIILMYFKMNYNNINTIYILLLDMLFAITIFNFKLFQKKIAFYISFLLIALLILNNNVKFSIPSIKMYFILLIIIFFRTFASKYSYKEIPTSNVKEGMILSFGSVLQFMPSKIFGLPKSTTEDIRSRLSPEEVESIKRWKNSKYGKETIIIVRKIPFAIFISLGTVLFIIIKVCIW